MRLGILGLPKSGKTSLFNLLTAARRGTDKFSPSTETNVGLARVPDPRLEGLRDLFRPRRFTPATVEYLDVPGLRRMGGGEDLDLAQLRSVDALVHVVRAFSDADIPHPAGKVDPQRDIATVDLELILADHGLVERRLERLAKASKRSLGPEEERERRLLAEVVLPALEKERPLREVELAPEGELRLRGFQLLSAKPLLVVVNLSQEDLAAAPPPLQIAPGAALVAVSAPLEEEISRLEAPAQEELLRELGLSEPSVRRVLRASYELLGLISFFTVGEDEVRAWTVRRGTTARQAAGAVHSDMERGFIRAEVVSWEDLLRLGSLAACREEGLLRVEGREYVVRDGEVVHVRFTR